MIFMTNCFLNHTSRIRSLSEHIIKHISHALIAGFVFIVASCEDPPGFAGRNLLPGSDFVEIESSLLKVRSYTMYKDSVPSGMPAVSYLGTINDPYFGTTTCEFVSQVRLANKWPGGSVGIIDSVKLFLKLLSVKGDVTDQHYLRLSEISDVIYDTVPYYSSQDVPVTPWSIEDIPLPALRPDTINNISMLVDNWFGAYILRDTSKLKYTRDVDFREYFRGLYFRMISPGDPLLVSLSCASPGPYGYYSNYFTVYFRDEYNIEKTFTFILDAVSVNVCYNLYRHDYSTATTGNLQDIINDTTVIDTISYLQQFNGVFTKLILTKLDSIKNSPEMERVSVNKARLKIPVIYVDPYYTRSNIPEKLYLRYIGKNDTAYFVPETYTNFYDGKADTTSTSILDDVYNLNIATFVQDYFNDETGTIRPELEMFLLPEAGNNVMLRTNSASKPIRFEFTYTKY
jgi:hypothetical protein